VKPGSLTLEWAVLEGPPMGASELVWPRGSVVPVLC
jgi:hypothetical protein